MVFNKNRFFCSFSDLKPFNTDEAPKKGVIFTDWKQSEDRHAIMAYSKDMVTDAFFFYTDKGMTLEAATEMLGVTVMSEKDFDDQILSPWFHKNAKNISKNIDKFWASRSPNEIQAPQNLAELDDMKAICEADNLQYDSLTKFMADPISKTHGDFHKFAIRQDWGMCEYSGTGAYVRGEINTYPKSVPAQEFARIASERYGLKAISSPLVPIRPYTDNSAESFFGWSVSGGIGCGSVAINLASGAVVPLDSVNDLSNHKHGWSYAHRYMGSHGHTGLMAIIRKHGEIDFGLCDEILELVGNGNLEAGKAKAARYLCALMVLAGWPEDEPLSVNTDDVAAKIFPKEVIGQ